MLEWPAYIKIFTTLLAIVKPTRGDTDLYQPDGHDGFSRAQTHHQHRKHNRCRVLIMAALLGKPLLDFFGISIASFKVGGAFCCCSWRSQ